MSNDALIRRLREERDELKERVTQLEAMLAVTLAPVRVWDLTRTETCYLVLLARGGIRSREQLQAAAIRYSKPAVGYGSPSPNTVDVGMSRIRRKLAAKGVVVSTVWGAGYVLEGNSLAAVRAALANAEGDDVNRV